MFLNGSLENFSVADILQLLSFSRQSGALYVQGEVGGVLYLEDGDVYFARRDSDWPLKDTLFANGVDESDWNGAVDQSDGRDAVGEALITRQAIDQDLLAYVVHQQLSDTLFDLFRMPRRGTFDFRVDERHEIGPVQRYKVDALIDDTRRRVDDWSSISEFISSPSAMVSVVAQLPAPTVELSLDGTQWELLLLAARRDRSTLTEMASALSRTDAEVARALDGLIRAGLLTTLEMTGDALAGGTPAPVHDIEPPSPVLAANLSEPIDDTSLFDHAELISETAGDDQGPGAEDEGPEGFEETTPEEALAASEWLEQKVADAAPEGLEEAGPEEASLAAEWLEEKVGTWDDGTSLADVSDVGAPGDSGAEVGSWWQEAPDQEPAATPWEPAGPPAGPEDPLSAEWPLGQGDVPAPAAGDEDLGDSIWGEVKDESGAADATAVEGGPAENAAPSPPELEGEASLWDTPDASESIWTPPAAEGEEPLRHAGLNDDSTSWYPRPGSVAPDAPDAPGSPGDPLLDAPEPPGLPANPLPEASESEASDEERIPEEGAVGSEPEHREGESLGFRTVALQELRDLAGVAAPPARVPGASKQGPEASEAPSQPPPAPKIRALKRLIAAVRGL
jgi:hypothetical protein